MRKMGKMLKKLIIKEIIQIFIIFIKQYTNNHKNKLFVYNNKFLHLKLNKIK